MGLIQEFRDLGIEGILSILSFNPSIPQFLNLKPLSAGVLSLQTGNVLEALKVSKRYPGVLALD